MKKTFTLITILSIAIASKAQQFPEGTILVGGAVGFSRSTLERTDLDDVRTTTINLTPLNAGSNGNNFGNLSVGAKWFFAKR